jgi:hypothetical protein
MNARTICGALCAATSLAGTSDCTLPGASQYKLVNATTTPDPPVQGSPALVLAYGSTTSVVTAGAGLLSVALDGVPLYSTAATTCGNTSITLPLGFGEIDIFSLACPSVVGALTDIGLSLTLPAGIPSGLYTVILSAADQNKAPVYCLNMTFSE